MRTAADTSGKIHELSKDKIELIRNLRAERARKARQITPIPRSPDGLLPTSSAQRRLWFIDQLEGGSPAYSISIALRLRGHLARPALRKSLDALLQRHESLRTVFVSVEGEPRQRVLAPETFLLDEVDLRTLRPSARDAEVHRLRVEEASRQFDLSTGPLIRGRLLEIGGDEHLFLVTMHHIVSDGWSIGVFLRELGELYSAICEQREPALAPMPIQYADYARWQEGALPEADFQEHLGYWSETLRGVPTTLDLPTDRPRPPKQSYRGRNLEIVLNDALCNDLRALAQRHDMTLFMVLYAGWAILLSRLSNQEDIAIGTPVANRPRPELAGLIGFFVNTLVLRSDVREEFTVSQFLKSVKDMTVGAYDHQQVAFERIVEALQPERSTDRNPVFQAMFALQNAPRSEVRWAGLRCTLEESVDEPAMFDLLVSLEERGQLVAGTINYAVDLFDEQTIQRWIASFREVLHTLARKPDATLGELVVLTGSEARVLDSFNDTDADCFRGQRIHDLFEFQAGETPEQIALEYDGTKLTYGQLNCKATGLATHLRQLGVAPNDLVGVCLERSTEMVVALLAILKAGAAYLPLDPNYPAERLKYMAQDGAPRLLIVDDSTRGIIPVVAIETLHLRDDSLSQLPEETAQADGPATDGAEPDLVYVIYTSGSTGRPKGTAMPHRAMVNLIEWHRANFGSSTGKRVAQFAALSFDVAFQEVFSTLCTGGTLVLIPEQIRRDAVLLVEFLNTHGVDRLFVPPLMLQNIAESHRMTGAYPRGLRDVIAAGEQLRVTPEIVQMFASLNGCRLHNHYGPTETHVVTALTLSGDPTTWPVLPSIGRPVWNTRIHVLNRHRRPVPLGAIGEIFIAGDCVARGYLRRPELTAQRFLDDPFSAQPGARMYRTGDTGRWRPDGTLEYLGRNDNQVKIRGHRVELGEIEAHLSRHDGVLQAAVVAREDIPGDKRLVAYIVPRPQTSVSLDTLRGYLRDALPDHMVPSAFVVMETFPVTPSGKLDRRSLPAPQQGDYANRAYAPPTTHAERALSSIWQELLRIEQVGRHDNFFELGGHSLLIVQMMDRIRRAGMASNMRDIYASATLADLAATLNGATLTGIEAPPNRIPLDAEQILPDMLPLIQLDAEQIGSILKAIPGGARNVQDIYPLAPLQEGILFHHVLDATGADVYTRPILLSLDSREVTVQFAHALQSVIDRHDVLRTAVFWEQLPRPVQVVCRHAELDIEELCLDADRPAIEQLKERFGDRVDIRQAPMMRLRIAKDPSSSDWYVLLHLHHLIFDNQSLQTLLSEVVAAAERRSAALPVPEPYRNYVAQALAYARTPEAESFFRSKLGDIEEPTAPYRLHDVRRDRREGHSARKVIDAALSRQLRDRARTAGVTPATLFHAAWALVLSHTTGRDDVVFGSVLLGRSHIPLTMRETIGMFINTLPLRLKLRGLSCRDLVEHARAELASLLVHEQASLALAQSCSGVAGGVPLFSSLLNYVHKKVNLEAEFTEAMGIRWLASRGGTNYPFVLSVIDEPESFTLELETDQRIDADRLMGYVGTIVRGLTEALERCPLRAALDLSVFDESERHLILEGFNGTRTPFPERRLLHEVFEEQAGRTPDTPAVIWEDECLTFAALNRRAEQVAALLRARGVGPDSLVGLCVERGLGLAVGIVGIWKAGGAYVPLDPQYPPERLSYMLRDAAPRVVLSETQCLERLPQTAAEVIALDQLPDGTERASGADARRPVPRPDHLAYVIYTSGSTGQPKGVMVEHRSVMSLWQGLERLYEQSRPCQRVAVNASITFDASIKQLIQLLSGRSIVPIPQRCRWDATQLLRFMEQKKIDCIDCTPSQLRTWLDAGLLDNGRISPHMVLIGGEPIDTQLWATLASSTTTDFYNVYGPTECTVDTTAARVNNDASPPHIGRPMENREVYLLDPAQRPVPLGVPGEIVVGGPGVARGYLNRPDLTAERFIDSAAFLAEPSARLYRTGDVGRWRPDGILEYLGRNDRQVKIRGFRVELSEIESALAELPHVRTAAVVVREDVPGEVRMVAYVAPAAGAQSLSREDLRVSLCARLPEYMVPAAIVVLDELPVTPNGKLDRKALPPPEQVVIAANVGERPQGMVEQKLAEIWSELLGVQRIGRDDNFFELGGHSLHGMKLMTRVSETLDVDLPVIAIFQNPTIREMASLVIASPKSHGAQMI